MSPLGRIDHVLNEMEMIGATDVHQRKNWENKRNYGRANFGDLRCFDEINWNEV